MKQILRDYQLEAVKHMKNGCILCGGVGSGKSRTSLAYYLYSQGVNINDLGNAETSHSLMNLYIITTARKRDTNEWLKEFPALLLGLNRYGETITVDSWNNIKKYSEIKHSFFIFDEQRLVGSGAWVKAFYKIAKFNKWILLTATPGDTWSDYIPVFVANGFYKNKTDFLSRHAVYDRYSKYPKINKYVSTGILLSHKRDILVNMCFKRETVSHHVDLYLGYDNEKYKRVQHIRQNLETGLPFETASAYCHYLRRIVNVSEERIDKIKSIVAEKKKVIIFYNYNYELEYLLKINYGDNFKVAQWNGKKHEPIPDSDCWIYLVQYSAGSEGWNCVLTDTIIFASSNYSYRCMVQAAGRIDRLNTPFSDLYFYHLKTKSSIDRSIDLALKQKKDFNASTFS